MCRQHRKVFLELEQSSRKPGRQSIPGFDFGRSRTIAPEPGMMLLFPAWMPHMVHPFYGLGERIAISFNVRVNDFSVGPPSPPAG